MEKEFEEIPEFVKNFVPGIMRGLSWAKYKQEKDEGTVLKSEAFQDSRKEGFQAVINAPVGPEGDQIFEKISKQMWVKVRTPTLLLTPLTVYTPKPILKRIWGPKPV